MRWIKPLVAVLVLFSWGCAHSTQSLPLAKEEPFRIGREDVLDISVWRDADISRVVPVRPDGYISLPLLGDIQAEGKTPGELAAELSAAFSTVVHKPRVNVLVREVNSTRVFVTGEVARPGSYPIRGRMSLLQAIALAGGFSAFADKEAIVLIRAGQQTGRFPVSYRALLEGEHPDVPLFSGDTIVVP